ncbi:polysaccharide biosynthesis tyrosine autokinase [Acidiferrimicrobium sp. IK]|uniref:polysaccharide biosynthesis tyrosine autokinase n=1 Tax=Acidiferrimicrobium sp. IK TaxID=2871700 RepID=UPI0021CB2ACD|nr:polysaccharide biosynthesis tyrosine autokinase [Acidiferrimicrobium sp. IK]MCU4187261.1 polysaccharide biosynthesis tyrosine autokinase [Acidiferrimicrobium sp. IK]
MPVEELQGEPQADLRAYLQTLQRRRTVIILTALVVVALALAYSLLASPVYSSSADVLVPMQPASAALNPTASQAPALDAQRTLADDLQFAQGDAVKRAANKVLGFSATPTISSSATADVLTFTAKSGHKAEAARIANVYAQAYIDQQRLSQVDAYTQQVTALQSSISDLQAKAAAAPAGSPEASALQQSVVSLTQSLQQLQAAKQLVAPSGATAVTDAVVPTSPVSPKPLRNGLIGLVVGLLFGVGLAFLAERLDDRINSREDAELSSGGLPIIGMVPMVDSWKNPGETHLALVEDPDSQVSEAYRTLRTAVQFLSIDEPKQVIAVTSSTPGEGKSTTVANLAVSLARAGHRVIVMSCDLRRPRLHAFFADSNDIGLTSVLLGEVPLASALLEVPDEPWLRVLASGPIPPNPAEILSLDRVREVVDTLAEAADMVLIDCPPVLPVTDALLLSRLVDGMLVLASARTTTKRDLSRTYELLQQVQAPLLGTVLTRVPAGSGYEYGYGYGYGYSNDEDRARRKDGRGVERTRLADAAVAAEATQGRGTPMPRQRRHPRVDEGYNWPLEEQQSANGDHIETSREPR